MKKSIQLKTDGQHMIKKMKFINVIIISLFLAGCSNTVVVLNEGKAFVTYKAYSAYNDYKYVYTIQMENPSFETSEIRLHSNKEYNLGDKLEYRK